MRLIYFCLLVPLLFVNALVTQVRHASGQSEVVADLAIKYGGPVLIHVGKYVLDRALLDGIFDGVTGQPNLAALNSRLIELENNAALRSEMQSAIKSFRLELDQKVSRQELEMELHALHDNLVGINERLTAVEIQNQLQEVRIEDLENGTQNGKKPGHFVDRGNRCLQTGDTFGAMANFAAALRIDKRCHEAYLSRASHYISLNAAEVAEIDYTSALLFDESLAPARIGRATCCLINRKWDEAIADTTAVLQEEPKSFDALFLRASAYISKDEADLAMRDLKACVALKPRSALVHNALAIAHRWKGEYDESLQASDRAIAINPMPLFFANRGETKRLKGDNSAALSDLNRALAHTAFKLDLANESSEPGPVAINYYRGGRESLYSNSETCSPYESRGLVHAALGETDEAIVDLTQAIDRGTQWFWPYAVRGKELLVKEKYLEGLADLNRGIELGVDKDVEYFVYHHRAVANYHLGRYSDAASDASLALAAPNQEGSLWTAKVNWLSFNANEKIGQGDAAYTALEAAVADNPAYADELTCGFIKVINSTGRDVDVCPDYFVLHDDEKVDTNNNWWLNGSETYWRFKAGESAFLSYKNLGKFRVKKFSLWLENAGTNTYGNTWTYTMTPGRAVSVVELTEAQLPE